MFVRLPIPEPADDLSGEEYIDIPDWHRKIIEERLAEYQTNGFEGTTWEEFEQELNEELKELLAKN